MSRREKLQRRLRTARWQENQKERRKRSPLSLRSHGVVLTPGLLRAVRAAIRLECAPCLGDLGQLPLPRTGREKPLFSGSLFLSFCLQNQGSREGCPTACARRVTNPRGWRGRGILWTPVLHCLDLETHAKQGRMGFKTRSSHPMMGDVSSLLPFIPDYSADSHQRLKGVN